MATTHSTTRPAAPKAFYSILNDQHGILAQVDGTVYHMSPETGDITPVTSYAGLTVLGEVGLADTQKILDRLHGGYAATACSRAQEIQ